MKTLLWFHIFLILVLVLFVISEGFALPFFLTVTLVIGGIAKGAFFFICKVPFVFTLISSSRFYSCSKNWVDIFPKFFMFSFISSLKNSSSSSNFCRWNSGLLSFNGVAFLGDCSTIGLFSILDEIDDEVLFDNGRSDKIIGENMTSG